MPASPCINICQMDAASGLCIGCLRTLDEIAAWGSASSEHKTRIWQAIDQRRREHDRQQGQQQHQQQHQQQDQQQDQQRSNRQEQAT